MRAIAIVPAVQVRSWRAGGLLCLGSLMAGCGSVGPSESAHGNFRAVLTLEPTVVKRGEQFTIRVEMINQSDEPLRLDMGMSCPFFTGVRRGDDPLHGAFPETRYSCLTIGSILEIPARDRYVASRPVTANVSPGDFEVHIDWTINDPPIRSLAAKLTVVP